MAMVRFLDQTPNGHVLRTFAVEVPNGQHKTVRELIELRVTTEVQAYNDGAVDHFNTLVWEDSEENAFASDTQVYARRVNERTQAYAAVRSFVRGDFSVRVNTRPVEGIDSAIELRPDTHITFVRFVKTPIAV